MDKVLEEQDSKAKCRMCNQQMSLILIGPREHRVWVHRGDALQTCQALKLESNFLKVLFERMRRFKWVFGKQYSEAGRPLAHGENPAKRLKNV